MMRRRVVDVWAQPLDGSFLSKLSSEVVPLLRKSGELAAVEAAVKMAPGGEVTVAEHVKLLDAAGIDFAIMSAWTGPQGAIVSNQRVAQFVRERPDRFGALCSVNIRDPVGACRELERCVREEGFIGARVLPWLWEKPPTDRLFYPLLYKCVELGVPFCTQVGHTGPMCPSEPGRPIPHIDQIALDFPDLKIVAGHVGYPWTEEMCAVSWKHRNVYIDTSAWLPSYLPQELVRFMSTTGKGKVMFGTNMPMISWSRSAKALDPSRLGFDGRDDLYQAFLSGTAEKVFQLKLPSPPAPSSLPPPPTCSRPPNSKL